MSLADHRPHHAQVATLVRDAAVELIPLKSAAEKLAVVPQTSTVTVTMSTKLGIDRTLELTAAAAAAGHRVVPHVAARQVADLVELQRIVGRLDELGVHDLYVVGGDAPEAVGDFHSAAELVEALAGFEHGLTNLGVACYPEGHPSISEAALSEALHRAQPHVDYMVSQLCFNHATITDWLTGTRADGITLPLHLGIAAPMQLRKLAELSLRIGVGSSVRYLTKQHGFIGKALRGSSYRPEQLLYELGDALSSPELDIAALHVFSFNQVAETVAWQDDVTRHTSAS